MFNNNGRTISLGCFCTFGFDRSDKLNLFSKGGETKVLYESNKDRVRFFPWNHMH